MTWLGSGSKAGSHCGGTEADVSTEGSEISGKTPHCASQHQEQREGGSLSRPFLSQAAEGLS